MNSIDQRTVTRPQPLAGDCDIGAYELNGGMLTIEKIVDPADGTGFPFTISPTIPFISPPVFEHSWGGEGDRPSQFDGPRGLGIDPAGNIYVADTDNSEIKKFDNDGNFLDKWNSEGTGPGQLKRPSDVAIDSGGNIFVADTGNSRIQKFDSAGTFLLEWGSAGSGAGQFNFNESIAIAPGQNKIAGT